LPFFKSLAASGPASANGTIWSSSRPAQSFEIGASDFRPLANNQKVVHAADFSSDPVKFGANSDSLRGTNGFFEDCAYLRFRRPTAFGRPNAERSMSFFRQVTYRDRRHDGNSPFCKQCMHFLQCESVAAATAGKM
jgi:hypothetical protein